MVKKNHADIIMNFGGMNIIKRSEAMTDEDISHVGGVPPSVMQDMSWYW